MQTAGRTTRGPWASRLAAIPVGALPVVVFPGPGLDLLAFVVLVPWLLLLRSAHDTREAVWRGWLGGTAYMLAVHHWLSPNVGVFMLPAGAALGALLVPWAVLVPRLLAPPITLRRLAAAMTLLPAAWVLAEYARSVPGLGGPWGLLGASQWSNPRVLGLAAVGAVWLVSAVLVAVNVAVTAAVAERRWQPFAIAGGLVAAALVVGTIAPLAPSARTVRVGGAQAGIVTDPEGRFVVGETATRRLLGEDLDLVVWGESSVPFDLDESADHRQRLQQLAGEVGAPLLVNTDARAAAGSIRKASVLVTSDGLAGRYDKMRLVPFGEYVPLRGVLGWLTAITEAADEDRERGEDLAVLAVDGFTVGPLVCFESAFVDLSRALARRGADAIVVQAATTTFQDSWAPAQHASLAAVRAVETGRPVVHATLSGVSAAFDSAGRRLTWVATDHTGPYTVIVPLSTGTTLAVRWGDWVPLLAVVVLILAAAVSLRVSRDVRGSGRRSSRRGSRAWAAR